MLHTLLANLTPIEPVAYMVREWLQNNGYVISKLFPPLPTCKDETRRYRPSICYFRRVSGVDCCG